MQALNLQGANMIAAAEGRLASLGWRLALGFVYALAVAFVLDDFALSFALFGLLCLSWSGDYFIGQRFIKAQTEPARKFYGAMFLIGCAVSITIFAGTALFAGYFGGAAGRVLCVLMAVGSLVSVMIFLFQERLFLIMTATPCLACLAMVPFAPLTEDPAGPLGAGIGMALGVAAFFAYLYRSATGYGRLFDDLKSANQKALDGQAEAESKRAEAERANLAKSEFLTTMTHELRTPLNAVIGYSEIIGEDMEAEGRADLAGDAKRINGAARHLLGLIDQILQLATSDADRSELQLDAVDVRALVEAAVEAAAPAAQANNSRISTRYGADISGAYTDGEKLGVCVSQLLSNAVKFTSNGLVAISVDREGTAKSPWLRIVVSDTGIGMAPEELEKAFQPFSQIDGSMTRTHGGMGLGLSITLRTAKVLGGEVVAVSERGAGSTFTLRVPMQLRAPEEVPEASGVTQNAGVGAAA